MLFGLEMIDLAVIVAIALSPLLLLLVLVLPEVRGSASRSTETRASDFR
jgi:hypothetical protein